jgi:hypothetical protein
MNKALILQYSALALIGLLLLLMLSMIGLLLIGIVEAGNQLSPLLDALLELEG